MNLLLVYQVKYRLRTTPISIKNKIYDKMLVNEDESFYIAELNTRINRTWVFYLLKSAFNGYRYLLNILKPKN